jgi:hypothetical protein
VTPERSQEATETAVFLVRNLSNDFVHRSTCRHARTGAARWVWADRNPGEDWRQTAPWLKPCKRCDPPSPLRGGTDA